MRLAGALRSPPDPQDFIYEHVASCPEGVYRTKFPEEFDLRGQAGPVRDQAARETCAAFTGATITTAKVGETQSAEFIYHHRVNKPKPGMFGRDVMVILQKIGSVSEKLFPYRGDENAPEPDCEMKMIAAKNRISNYAKVESGDGLKRALLENGPGLVILPCYNDTARFWINRGNEEACGHAVTAVGFNKLGFVLRNSWGADWNGDGHTILPYAEFDCAWEVWVAAN